MIETANLKLIPATLKHFEAILAGHRRLEQMLGVTVFDEWYEFPGVAGAEAIQFSYDYLKANKAALGWWTYLFTLQRERACRPRRVQGQGR
jgi:[ribosomal protein S5]-alanine N-acetyltransferase